MAKTVRKTDGWKSKQWYSVVSPELLGSVSVGEAVANNPDTLVGRVVETTLGDVLGDYSKQNVKLRLKVDRFGGDTAYTKFVEYQLTQDYLRSLVKRRSSIINLIVDVVTKDGSNVRVKPCSFTIKRAHLEQVRGIRRTMGQIIEERARDLDFDQFIQEILSGKLSATIYKEVKNIYPLRRVEIGKVEVMGKRRLAAV